MSRKLETIQFSKRSLKNFKKMGESLFGSDLMLMLLSISTIKGTTKLQKQVFLTWKMLFKKKTIDPGFFPYKFGAYSRTIEDSIYFLKKSGFIRVKPGRDEVIQYFITPRGKRSISKKLKRMNINLEKLKEKKTDWDEWTTKAIMKFVYRNYPEYTTETKVPYLKW